MAIENFTIPQVCSYTMLWFIFNRDISLRMSLAF